ncbi:Jacalin-like lectin domain-containing protein [Trichoderma chlorosporum]
MSSVINPPVGGPGGKPFNMRKSKAVRSLYVWAGAGVDGAKPYRVLKGIQLVWNDNSEAFVGVKTNDGESFIFQKDEKISHMEIWASLGRVDALKFETDKSNNFSYGGDGGSRYEQHVGNGVLTGFHGAATGDVDRLGAIFGESCSKSHAFLFTYSSGTEAE